jgi:hypothetical protein
MTTKELEQAKDPENYPRAFPVAFPLSGGGTVHVKGLSKREWFAGMALQGLLGNMSFDPSITDQIYAERSAILADALIERLKQP